LQENNFYDLITPMLIENKFIKVNLLLQFLEGKENLDINNYYSSSKTTEEEEKYDKFNESKTNNNNNNNNNNNENNNFEKDYEFSKNIETKRLEKKIRTFGRILSKKGTIDIELLFKNYDPKQTGFIQRSDFIEVLSKIGMYILEKGFNILIIINYDYYY
jgi:hypothetical protein